MKQSRSSVDKDMGSLRELTKAPVAVPFCCPLKLTMQKHYRDFRSINEKTTIKRLINYLVVENLKISKKIERLFLLRLRSVF